MLCLMQTRLSVIAAAALALVGITIAILLPSQTVSGCPRGGLLDGCLPQTELHLLPRFVVAIGSALPLAALLAGRSARRWRMAAASIILPSAIGLAFVLASSQFPTQLAGALCSTCVDYLWWRFAILVGALVSSMMLVAAPCGL